MIAEHVRKALRRYVEDFGSPQAPVLALFPDLVSCQTIKAAQTVCYQPFKGLAQSLESAGYSLDDELKQEASSVVIFAQRCREENLGYLGRTAALLPEGGQLYFVCPNELGPKSHEKRIMTLFGNLDVFSKYKVRISVATKTDAFDERFCQELIELSKPFSIPNCDLVSYAGNFSWKHVDTGSQLLVDNLPKDIKGVVADFGAGYGFISKHVLDNYDVEELHLFEHDRRALDAAELNCKNHKEKCHFHWENVVRLESSQKFDWIIMNPPFHIGNKTDPELGIKFLEKAIQHIKPSGHIVAVANKSLPYEASLKTWGRDYSVIQLKGFKVVSL